MAHLVSQESNELVQQQSDQQDQVQAQEEQGAFHPLGHLYIRLGILLIDLANFGEVMGKEISDHGSYLLI
jgi:hypothetical protein